MLAYDPFVEELVMSEYDSATRNAIEVLQQSDFVSIQAPAALEAQGILKETHSRRMKKNAVFVNAGRGPTDDETPLI
jgi:D-3-phosphoglycerate dehydrogenase / 2-oxoglutarate reductase